MKFNTTKAKQMYYDMFGSELDRDTIKRAQKMSEAEFEQAKPACTEDGDYNDSPFSFGEYAAISYSRNG